MSDITIRRQQQNIEVSQPRSDYHLPIASETILGGIKVGNNLSITSDGTLSAVGEKYSLPVASASTLGGIKVGSYLSIADGVLSANVDNTLSLQSTNPISNSVISSALNGIENTTDAISDNLSTISDSVNDLSETVAGHTSTISELDSDVTTLSSTVQTNTDNITTNTNDIASNLASINALDDRMDTAEGNITDLGNAISEMGGEINDLIINIDTDVEYSYLLPVNTWSQGKITYSQRGKVGLITFSLNGNMSLAANTETQIYQLPDTFQNSIVCIGTLNTNVGPITVSIDSNRNISFGNITANAMNQITKVRGQLTVVLE